jgi:predicted Zn finger-like uncharacterized protein
MAGGSTRPLKETPAFLDMGAGIGDLGQQADSPAIQPHTMILTCPECATRYFVPDESVGPAGRTVRCASCGAAWRAEAETPLDLTPATAEEDPAPAEAEAPAGKDPARVFREKITARREAKKAVTASAVWATAGLVLIGLLTLLIIGRNTVARVWPASASAYTAVGLKVNIVGLEIEDQVVEQGFADGRPALLVRGTLVNVTTRPVRSPPVRLDLLDAEENILAVKIASPPDAISGRRAPLLRSAG